MFVLEKAATGTASLGTVFWLVPCAFPLTIAAFIPKAIPLNVADLLAERTAVISIFLAG